MLIGVAASVASAAADQWEPPAVREARQFLGADYPREAIETQVVAERIGPVYVAPPGPLSAALPGDWRLANDRICLIFAGVEDAPTSQAMTLAGEPMVVRPEDRYPGALVDIMLDGYSLDFISTFSQGVGIEPGRGIVNYDFVEIVRDGQRLGLRMEGSPFDNAIVRLETTYWLAPGRDYVEIESRFLDIGENDPLPDLVDVGYWSSLGLMFAKDHSFIHSGTVAAESEYIQVHVGNMNVMWASDAGAVEHQLNGSPALMRSRLTPEDTAAPADRILRRKLWITKGYFSQALAAYLKDTKKPHGEIQGTITDPVNGKPLRGMLVEAATVNPNDNHEAKKAYTMARSDADGHYSLTLPPGLYLISHRSQTRDKLRIPLLVAREVNNGDRKTLDLKAAPDAGVMVKAIDSRTSAPLAARMKVEPVAPTRGISFGLPIRAKAYQDMAYLPPEGWFLPLPEGHWKVTVTHGISYDSNSIDFVLEPGGVAKQITIPLFKSSPTPEWQGVELGLRTSATPGSMIHIEDAVQMSAAEGLEWIVSGDFETLTDFAPEIEKAGFAKVMRSSIGFRTMSTRHPEWGQILVYPVPADAPDPAKVRERWSTLGAQSEMIATIREFYPGAIVQTELPYTLTGKGYFSMGDENPGRVAYSTPKGVETSIDAINLFPGRSAVDFRAAKAFLYYNWIDGRPYIPVSSNSGRLVFGAEPGYPRLLVLTGQEDLATVEEQQLFQALRERRIQITTGPFVDMRIGDARPGDSVPQDSTDLFRLRVTAPNWVVIDQYRVDKEGLAQLSITSQSPSNYAQRFPPVANDQLWYEQSFEELKIRADKDTLLGISVFSSNPMSDYLAPYNGPAHHMSFVAPILIDINKNGKFDELESARDIGK